MKGNFFPIKAFYGDGAGRILLGKLVGGRLFNMGDKRYNPCQSEELGGA